MRIRSAVPLAPFTTYRVGGLARYFSEVDNRSDLIEVLNWAYERNLPVFVLGGGSNVLFSDNGFPGLVVRYLSAELEVRQSKSDWVELYVGAGLALKQLVDYTLQNGYGGLVWASGIPGLLGGALKINASAFSGSMKEVVLEIETYDPHTGMAKFYGKEASLFDYKDTIFLRQASDEVILGARVLLGKEDQKALRRRHKQILFYRSQKHPSEPSCGSVFKNITDPAFIKLFLEARPQWRKQYTTDWNGKIPAGLLIDEAGLRGKSIGGAMVSEKHANFIVNRGGAKADEIVQLMSLIKDRVQQEFGVILQNEVRLVGF